MRTKIERGSFVPPGAIRVQDKLSDAIAFVYVASGGRPAAMVFMGRKARPYWHRLYRDKASRERDVTSFFESRRQVAQREAERRVQAARPHGLEVGHVLVASWGYDQTNVNFYQVTALIGRSMVEIRAIATTDANMGNESWATGKALPALDNFTGEPMRRRADGHRRVRIDDVRTAQVWDGRPERWSAYA